jgi:uncharacterized protein (TIGR02246 family)
MKLPATLAGFGLILAGISMPLAAQDETRKTARPAGRAGDEKAIRAVAAAFVRAYNAADTRALSELFTEDAEVINEDGQVTRGREAITGLFAWTFEEFPGERIEIDEQSIRFLGPEVAEEEGRTRILPSTAPRELATERTNRPVVWSGVPHTSRYTVLYVRQNGRWLQSSVHEFADMAVTPHQRLEPLGWLLGEWVDEGSAAVVHSNTRWSDDGNFLLREFTIQIAGKGALRGTQRIGWDRQTQQITSWMFDSEGGHGVGLWAHDGDRWVIKVSDVLHDGRTATATEIYSVVNPHTVRWKSVDRTLGEHVEPDTPEFMMVRRPPTPALSPSGHLNP